MSQLTPRTFLLCSESGEALLFNCTLLLKIPGNRVLGFLGSGKLRFASDIIEFTYGISFFVSFFNS